MWNGRRCPQQAKKKSRGIPFNTPRLQRTMLWWMTEVETARIQLPATDSWRTDVQKERCEDKGDIRRVRFPSCHHSIAYSNLWASVNISMTLQHEKDFGHLLHDLSAFRFWCVRSKCGAGPHNGGRTCAGRYSVVRRLILRRHTNVIGVQENIDTLKSRDTSFNDIISIFYSTVLIFLLTTNM